MYFFGPGFELAQQERGPSIPFQPAAHIDALALKVAHRADFSLFRPAGRTVQVGIGTQFFLKAEPEADNDKLRKQEKNLAVSNGLLNKPVGIVCPDPLLPDKGRPRRIPGKAEGDSPRLAESGLILKNAAMR